MSGKAKYKCKEDYFIEIINQNQAYILGFIWADGSLSRRGGLSFSIKSADVEILKFVLSELESDIPISYYKVKNKEYCRVTINRLKIYDSLYQLGLGKNKSCNNAPIPNIPEELIPHFLRGLFDGDGSIWINTGYRANFSGGQDFLLWVEKQLNKVGIRCNPLRYRYGKGNLNSCSLPITGRDNIEKLKTLLYKKSCFYLERKFELFEDAEQSYKQRDFNNWKLNGLGHKIQNLKNEGMYPTEIAKKLKLNFNTVRGIFRQLPKNNYGTTSKQTSNSYKKT